VALRAGTGPRVGMVQSLRPAAARLTPSPIIDNRPSSTADRRHAGRKGTQSGPATRARSWSCARRGDCFDAAVQRQGWAPVSLPVASAGRLAESGGVCEPVMPYDARDR